MTAPISIGPKLLQVPSNMAVATKPKLVDFTNLDIYPSKYKIVNGKAVIRSLVIEDIERQKDVLAEMNTTVMIGDKILVDFKFGHLENGKWVDVYVKGVYRVKQLSAFKTTKEILLLVTEDV
jgi:hypothetical protein